MSQFWKHVDICYTQLQDNYLKVSPWWSMCSCWASMQRQICFPLFAHGCVRMLMWKNTAWTELWKLHRFISQSISFCQFQSLRFKPKFPSFYESVWAPEQEEMLTPFCFPAQESEGECCQNLYPCQSVIMTEQWRQFYVIFQKWLLKSGSDRANLSYARPAFRTISSDLFLA